MIRSLLLQEIKVLQCLSEDFKDFKRYLGKKRLVQHERKKEFVYEINFR